MNWAARIEQWLFETPDDVKGPALLAARVLRYLYAIGRDLGKGDLTLRAMSLVYTTLLSIVPIIAISFSILKAFNYDQDLEVVLWAFAEPLGERGEELATQIMGFVNNVKGEVLGSIGLLFLLYTVVTTVQKIEESFNFIWRVEKPRSFARRFSEYLSVIIVGPALIAAAIGLLTTFSNGDFVQMLRAHEPFGTMIVWLGNLVPYLLVIGVFAFLYGFIPNTHVRVQAAMIGAVFAGVLWVSSGAVFTSFVARSTTTIVIYAGFAIVILALIWVYLSWLVLLIGAQLAFYVQNPHYLRPGRSELHLTNSLRERLALSVCYLIACDYAQPHQRWTLNKLAGHLDVPSAALGRVVGALEARGLLVATDQEVWLPGRDPANIELAEILDSVRNDHHGPKLGKIRSILPAVDVALSVEQSIKQTLGKQTLRDLVQQHSSVETGKHVRHSAAS